MSKFTRNTLDCIESAEPASNSQSNVQSADATQDLTSLCSGKFPSQLQQSQAPPNTAPVKKKKVALARPAFEDLPIKEVR